MLVTTKKTAIRDVNKNITFKEYACNTDFLAKGWKNINKHDVA